MSTLFFIFLYILDCGRNIVLVDACDYDEMIRFSKGAADVGVLLTSGCSTMYTRPSRRCCEFITELASNPCAEAAIDEYNVETVNPPHLDFVYKVMNMCGFEFRGEVNTTGCGDYVVDESEQCDTGPASDGSGCTECFVDEGYTCTTSEHDVRLHQRITTATTPSASTSIPSPEESVSPQGSVCRECERECDFIFREICPEAGGPCGACWDGYAEDASSGLCSPVHRVFYTVIDSYYEPPGGESHCIYQEVGLVTEATPEPTATVYVDAVRQWKNATTGGSDDGDGDDGGSVNGGACFVKHALKHRPAGDDVVVVMEVVVPRTYVYSVDLLSNDNVVIFSEGPSRAKLVSEYKYTFDVYMGSTFYVYNMDYTEISGYEGAMVRNFGRVVFENVSSYGNTEYSLVGVSYVTWQCLGMIAMSSGQTFIMKNVEIYNNNFAKVENQAACLIYENSMVSLSGVLILEDVTFLDNFSEGVMLHIKYVHSGSRVRNVRFIRNVSKNSLISADVNLFASNFVAEENILEDGAVLHLGGHSEILNFAFVDNVIAGNGWVVRNLGSSFFKHGVVRGTRTYDSSESQSNTIGFTSDRVGTVTNQAILQLYNVTFEENMVGAIKNMALAKISSSKFRRNRAGNLYTSIYNSAYLEIDNSEFANSAEDLGVATIYSTSTYILRDSDLPNSDPALLRAASCDDVISQPDGSETHPCGVQALCFNEGYDGVYCTCPDGFIGSPVELCGPAAAVHILPNTAVVSFPVKDAANASSQKVLGLLSDGLGSVSWSIRNESIPTWLTLSPTVGLFVNDGVCPSDIEDLTVIFRTQGIYGNDTEREAFVIFDTLSQYKDAGLRGNITLSVTMSVEVVANATMSSVTVYGSCDENVQMCVAKAASRVSLLVELHDAEGLPMRIGGSVPTVRVLSVSEYDLSAADGMSTTTNLVLVSLIDRTDGTYEVSFLAPQQPFVLDVEINGTPIQGMPVFFDVECLSGWGFDSSRGECVKSTPSVPLAVIVIAMSCLLFFVGGSFSYLYKNRKYFEDMFRLIMTEVTSITLAGVGELFDLLSDTGAFITVLLTEELQQYTTYYTIVYPLSVVASTYYFATLISDLRTALRKKRYGASDYNVEGALSNTRAVLSRTSARAMPKESRVSQGGTRLRQSVVVVGMGTFTTLEELDESIIQLQNKLRRMQLELLLVVVEDVPMMTLATVAMMRADEQLPFSVIISLEISCVMTGITLTNFRGINDTKKQLERLRLRRKELAQSIPSLSRPNLRLSTKGGDDAGNSNKNKFQGVTHAILQTCTIS